MITLKRITKKHKSFTFHEIQTLSLKELQNNNSILFQRLSHKEIVDLLSKLSMLNCIAVEHKGIIYLCKMKQNYSQAVEQIKKI